MLAPGSPQAPIPPRPQLTPDQGATQIPDRGTAQALAYHPAGVTQEALLREDAAHLAELGVRVISTETLFGGVTYVPLNLGEGYGVLSLVAPDGGRPATIRDVAVFTALPNDLGHVAGVVSETPQTPLSHVNLKA